MAQLKFLARKGELLGTYAWEMEHTAAIVIDMWDIHWCKSATERMAEILDPMNNFLTFLRNNGLKVVAFCPTSVADAPAHKDSIPRRRAKSYPNSPVSFLFDHSIPPVDSIVDPFHVQCDCATKCVRHRPWSQQNSQLFINEQTDLIFDEMEYHIFHAFNELKIDNIFFLGVHANMCVINRRFGLRHFNALQKYNLVLVRDLTDSMTPSEEKPYLGHFGSLGSTIAFIEKYFARSASANSIMGNPEHLSFFKNDNRIKNIIKAHDSGSASNSKKQSTPPTPYMVVVDFDKYTSAVADIRLISSNLPVIESGKTHRQCCRLKDGEYINGLAVTHNNAQATSSIQIAGITLETNLRSLAFNSSQQSHSDVNTSYYCNSREKIIGFFGAKKNGVLRTLGLFCSQVIFLKELFDDQIDGEIKTVVEYLDDKQNIMCFEICEDKFLIYPPGKKEQGFLCNKLYYTTDDGSIIASSIEGVIFVNDNGFKSASIYLEGDALGRTKRVFLSTPDGQPYVPTQYQGIYPAAIIHPYYQRTIRKLPQKTALISTGYKKYTPFNDLSAYLYYDLVFPKAIFCRKTDILNTLGLEYENGIRIVHGKNDKGILHRIELEINEYITSVSVCYERNFFLLDMIICTNKGRLLSTLDINKPLMLTYDKGESTHELYKWETIDLGKLPLAAFWGGMDIDGNGLTSLGAYIMPQSC